MAKRLIIVAGPNGAGKTTFARDYLQEYPLAFLSADDLALKMSPERPDLARISAGRSFSEQLGESIKSGASIVIESTLAGSVFQPVAFGDREDYEVTDEDLLDLFLRDVRG